MMIKTPPTHNKQENMKKRRREGILQNIPIKQFFMKCILLEWTKWWYDIVVERVLRVKYSNYTGILLCVEILARCSKKNHVFAKTMFRSVSALVWPWCNYCVALYVFCIIKNIKITVSIQLMMWSLKAFFIKQSNLQMGNM